MSGEFPVKKAFLVTISILLILVIGSFFLINFFKATNDVNIPEVNPSQCNAKCNTLVAAAITINSCDKVSILSSFKDFSSMNCTSLVGTCNVTISNGVKCTCDDTSCKT